MQASERGQRDPTCAAAVEVLLLPSHDAVDDDEERMGEYQARKRVDLGQLESAVSARELSNERK